MSKESELVKKYKKRLHDVQKTIDLLKTVNNTLTQDTFDTLTQDTFDDLKIDHHFAIIIPNDSKDNYSRIKIDEIELVYYGKLLYKQISNDGKRLIFQGSRDSNNGFRNHLYKPENKYIDLDMIKPKTSYVTKIRKTVKDNTGGKKKRQYKNKTIHRSRSGRV
jgi:hypothetical protein